MQLTLRGRRTMVAAHLLLQGGTGHTGHSWARSMHRSKIIWLSLQCSRGLIGSHLSTAWLTPSAQARFSQVCQMQHSSVWLISAWSQSKKK